MNNIDADDLAQIIRQVDGNHDLGAGALAEAILDRLPAPKIIRIAAGPAGSDYQKAGLALATPGPWYVHTDPGDPDGTFIYDETGHMCIAVEPAGSDYRKADLALAAAAPDLAQTIATLRWEWRCEAYFNGTWAGLTAWESSPDYARATMQRRHRYPTRLVRRLVGPAEVIDSE